MARRAHAVGVAMVNRELRVLRVVERRVQPVASAVAVLARRREELRLRRMSRIGRAVVIRLVTANARRWKRLVVIVDVAVGASPRRYHVRSGQWERRVVVIECCVRPVDRVVAELTGGREAGMGHRAVRVLEIRLMARNAQRAVQVVVVINMAVGASPRRHGVRSG